MTVLAWWLDSDSETEFHAQLVLDWVREGWKNKGVHWHVECTPRFFSLVQKMGAPVDQWFFHHCPDKLHRPSNMTVWVISCSQKAAKLQTTKTIRTNVGNKLKNSPNCAIYWYSEHGKRHIKTVRDFAPSDEQNSAGRSSLLQFLAAK
jgi:hypothetical protein